MSKEDSRDDVTDEFCICLPLVGLGMMLASAPLLLYFHFWNLEDHLRIQRGGQGSCARPCLIFLLLKTDMTFEIQRVRKLELEITCRQNCCHVEHILLHSRFSVIRERNHHCKILLLRLFLILHGIAQHPKINCLFTIIALLTIIQYVCEVV